MKLNLPLFRFASTVLLLCVAGYFTPSYGQAPTITSLSPSTTKAIAPTAEVPGLTITVTGTGFSMLSTVQWTGVDLQTKTLSTTVLSSTVLSALVPRSDLLAAGTATVKVSNVSPPGSISNPATFTITPATTVLAPVLSNISARVVAQGTRQMQLTLVGANFRAGARVVVGASQSNPGLVQASDITIENVTRLNDSTIQALLSVAPQASLENRAVDVVNADKSSTNAATSAFGSSSTTMTMRVQPGNSLGAPLQVTTLVVNYPRDGAVVNQGDSIYGEAVLSGAGTGTVIGQWIWDGNVLEQFAVSLTGGTSQTVRTSSSLPTSSLGSHALSLKITSPNSIQSPARTVVVSPGDLKQERLLEPQAGQGFPTGQSPLLKWTIVPGAAKYQVGFSSQPLLRTITEWHDVSGTEWKVPAEIWDALPEGELYWTVRPIEMSGASEKAALMRSIKRGSGVAPAPTKSSANAALRSATLIALGFLPPAASAQQDTPATIPGTDAETPPPAPPSNVQTNPNFLKSQITSNTQSVSRQEPEKNDVSIVAQGLYVDGAWKAELNSTGIIASNFTASPRHVLGTWNDYVFKLTRGAPQGRWGAEVSFGMVAPQGMLNSEFITTGFAREGVEGALRTPVGKLSFYRNTNDKGLGEGVGFGFHQQVQSLSYEMPALKLFNDAERVKFRVTYMGARDIDSNPASTDPFARPRVGDTLGGLLTIRLNRNFVWNTEYAVASNNVDRLSAGSTREHGRAFRSGIAGTWHQASISLAFRKVSPAFAIPASANLTQLSQSNRRGMDFSIGRQTRIGTLSGTYQVLGSDFNYADRAHLVLHNIGVNWSKMVSKSTTLGLGATDAITLTTGHAIPSSVLKTDQRRFGITTSVTEMINSKNGGSLMLTLTGTRNWLRDNINANTNNIVSTVAINPNWMPKPSIQIQGNYSVNWIVGERSTSGSTRVQTLFLQPTFHLAQTGWSVTPLVSINEMKSEVGGGFKTSDLLTSQVGTRITYRLPGRLNFNSFSFEGSYNRSRDALTNTTVSNPRFLVIWTLIGSRAI